MGAPESGDQQGSPGSLWAEWQVHTPFTEIEPEPVSMSVSTSGAATEPQLNAAQLRRLLDLYLLRWWELVLAAVPELWEGDGADRQVLEDLLAITTVRRSPTSRPVG